MSYIDKAVHVTGFHDQRAIVTTGEDHEVDVDVAERHIDEFDKEIIDTVRKRTALANALGGARLKMGQPRIVHEHDIAMIWRYLQLGPAGRDIALILLRIGR